MAGEAAHVGASSTVELWINRGRFAGPNVKRIMSVAEIRALPLPAIPDDHDLYWQNDVGGEDRILTRLDETFPVKGKRFYSVPRFINAG